MKHASNNTPGSEPSQKTSGGRSRGVWRRRRELPEPPVVFNSMSEWLETPLGKTLLDIETGMLEPILARVFGYHILQLGCSHRSLLGDSPVGHKIQFAPEHLPGTLHPVASNESLPLASASVDAVLIHHALDFTPDSYRLLREAARVTMPGGKILIIGFNPVSSWGFRRLFHWRDRLPWNARFISCNRVTDWLRLLDFKIDRVVHGGYLLPFNRTRVVNSAPRLEAVGRWLGTPTGAVYFIVACKQVMPVTPIVPRWPRIPTPVIVRPVGEVAGARNVGKRAGKIPGTMK